MGTGGSSGTNASGAMNQGTSGNSMGTSGSSTTGASNSTSPGASTNGSMDHK
jgi:hypothetical protein